MLENRQNMKLAAMAKRLTRRLSEEPTAPFTPDTLHGICFAQRLRRVQSLRTGPIVA